MTEIKTLIEDNINKILEERKKILEKYKLNESTYINRIILYEGLLFSATPQKFLNILKRYGFENVEFCDKGIDGGLCVMSKVNKNQFSILNQICNVCGWKIAMQFKRDGDYRCIFMRKFGDDADNLVYNDCQGLLFHITPLTKLAKIKTQGLTPKAYNKNENHEDRIYLTYDRNYAVTLAKQLIQYNKWDRKSIQNNEYPFGIVVIMLNRLNNDHDVKPKFFIDPNSPNSVYTHNNIPPKAIVTIEKIKVSL